MKNPDLPVHAFHAPVSGKSYLMMTPACSAPCGSCMSSTRGSVTCVAPECSAAKSQPAGSFSDGEVPGPVDGATTCTCDSTVALSCGVHGLTPRGRQHLQDARVADQEFAAAPPRGDDR